MKLARTLGLVCGLGVAMPALAETAALPANYPADYGALITGAKAEKSLLIYTNMEVVQWEGAVKILKEMVPGLDVKFLELNSGEIVSRYNAETSAGIPSADLLVTTDAASWVEMMEKGQIDPYMSPEAGIYPAWSKPHPGLYTIAADPMMFMWNKALLPKNLEPSSFADLVEKVKANPAVFKNKITTYNPQTPYGYNAFYTFAQYHGDKAWEWFSTLAPLTRPDGTGPMIEKVTSGEYILSYFMGAGAARLALKDPARASLIGLKPISDGNLVVLRGVAVPKKAPHPSAAKLMVDVLLSKPGQISLGVRARTPLRPDVTSADVNGEITFGDVVKLIGEDKIIPITFDPKMSSNATFDAFVARYKAVSGK